MPKPRKSSGKRDAKKKKQPNDGEELLKLIGSSANPDKRTMTIESTNLLEEIGRSYTETGRHAGETEGDNLLMMIGSSSADQAVKAVGYSPDPQRIAAQVQAEAEQRRRQMEEDRGGYPQEGTLVRASGVISGEVVDDTERNMTLRITFTNRKSKHYLYTHYRSAIHKKTGQL